MNTPDSIKTHASKYANNAWQNYSISELGDWVHLLTKRATHRTDREKRAKDIEDAQNYLDMIQAHVNSLRV